MKSLLLFLCFCMSFELMAKEYEKTGKLKIDMINDYNKFFTEKVSMNLNEHHQQYREYPNIYWDFLSKNLLINWDFKVTTQVLMGAEIYYSLSEVQLEELSQTVAVTLIRYAYESLHFFNGQKITAVDIKFNDTESLAWLQINIDSQRLPKVNLDILLKRTRQNNWKFVDFKFKGVSYTDIKKRSYRQDFKELGYDRFLKTLKHKNESFFSIVCNKNISYISLTNAPCLQADD